MRIIATKLLSKLSSFYQNGDIDTEEKDKLGNLISEAVKKNNRQEFINEIIRLKKTSLYTNEVYEELLNLVQ